MRILENEPKNLDDALNLASRLEAFDIMGSTGPEAEKSNSRFVRAAAGSKESTGSGEAKMSEEILKQLVDLKGLVCSYRRDLDKQQQVIEGLKRSYQPPYQGNFQPGASSTLPEPAQVPQSQSDRVADQSETEEDTGRVVDLKQETLVRIVEETATGPANVGSRRVWKHAGGTTSYERVDQHYH